MAPSSVLSGSSYRISDVYTGAIQAYYISEFTGSCMVNITDWTYRRFDNGKLSHCDNYGNCVYSDKYYNAFGGGGFDSWLTY